MGPLTPVRVAVYELLDDELHVRVDDPLPTLTLVGLRVQVSPDGVDMDRLTDPVKPLTAPADICAVPACPARKETVLGEEEITKSAGRNNGPPKCAPSM